MLRLTPVELSPRCSTEALARCDTLSAEFGTIAAERDALAERNERLHHLLLKLKRRQFGQKSERLPETTAYEIARAYSLRL